MMASTLFGYNVEEDDGKLVITIHGVLAEGMLRTIHSEAQAGKGSQILSKLLPLKSLYRVLSGDMDDSAENSLTTEQIFSQSVDQTFQSFEQQITELRATLSDVNRSSGATESPTIKDEKGI
jgi:hypothetical protein